MAPRKGFKHSLLTKKRMSKTRRGRKYSKLHKKAIAKALKLFHSKSIRQRGEESRLHWAARAWKKYRIRPIDVAIMFNRQNGICPLCSEPFNDKWVIDHCHETGKFRGLLHQSCNRTLGIVEVRFGVAWLDLAKSYLGV